MGTRAAFFIGDPRDIENRKWLGCVAWDGYPDGDCGKLADATTEVGFRALFDEHIRPREDFCDPEKHGFPFPWVEDLFLTDWVYALFDGTVQATHFHAGFAPLRQFLDGTEEWHEAYGEGPERLPSDTPAPARSGTGRGRTASSSSPRRGNVHAQSPLRHTERLRRRCGGRVGAAGGFAVITPPDPTKAEHYWLTGPGVEALLMRWRPMRTDIRGLWMSTRGTNAIWQPPDDPALAGYTTAASVLTPAEIAALHAALENMVNHYTALINSGDCGFWDPEKEPAVIAARAAIKRAREG